MGTKIEVFRGNSKYIGVFPMDSEGENPVFLGDSDKVIFSVKGLLKTYITKTFTKQEQNAETGEIIIRIAPEETLSMFPGHYLYDCLYVFSDTDDPYTFIEPSDFEVIDTVSKSGDVYG